MNTNIEYAATSCAEPMKPSRSASKISAAGSHRRAPATYMARGFGRGRRTTQITASTTRANSPTATSTVTLFAMSTARSSIVAGRDVQVPASGVGTSATAAAQTPARFSRKSSRPVLPFRQNKQVPMLSSAPTK